MSERALPPVLVFISDSQPTDDFEGGLTALIAQPWGKKAVRLAIGTNNDVDLEPLRKFIWHVEIPLLQANTPEALTRYIKWVSTAVLQAASASLSQVTDVASGGGSRVPVPVPLHLPLPAPLSDADSAPIDDVW